MSQEGSVDPDQARVVVGSSSNFWVWSCDTGWDLTHPPTPEAEPLQPRLVLQCEISNVAIDPAKTALLIIDMQNFLMCRALRVDTAIPAMFQAQDVLLEYGIPAARQTGIQIIWLNWGLDERDLQEMPPATLRVFNWRANSEGVDYGISARDPANNKFIACRERLRGTGLGMDLGTIMLDDGTIVDAGRALMRDTWNARLHEPLASAYEKGGTASRPDVLIHKNRNSGLCGSSSVLAKHLEEEGIQTLLFTGANIDQCVMGTLQDANLAGFDTILLKDGCATDSPKMIKIKLEDTLFESFAAEDSPTPNVSASKTFIAYNPVSGKQVTPTIPPNTQYMIQQWRGSSVENFSPIINLVLMPQRMAWMAGMMPVIFIQHDVDPGRTGPTLEDDLEQTLAVLDPSCRFAPRFCKSLQEIHESVGSTEIIPFLPSDGLANLRLFNDPDDHYFLLSKRGLALSGLPTPKAQLVDFAVPQTAWSSDTLNHEISQAVKAIHERRPPFVLKSNSAGGSKGTYLIHNSEEKVMVEKDIANILLAELPTLNLANAYLHPLSLIMTDLLPGDAIGFNFYVHADGTAQFSTSTSQNFSKTHMWQGSTVIYSAQARLASEYADLIQTTARYLHSHGYRGPVGIDVMTDRTGVQNIVDLNPRPTGSFVLGCLRPHFAGVLGMDAVCTLPFMEFSATRKTFEKAFEKELQIGQMVVLAWYSDLKALRCSTCLAVSSVDKDSLGRLCAAIQEWVDENQSLKGG